MTAGVPLDYSNDAREATVPAHVFLPRNLMARTLARAILGNPWNGVTYET